MGLFSPKKASPEEMRSRASDLEDRLRRTLDFEQMADVPVCESADASQWSIQLIGNMTEEQEALYPANEVANVSVSGVVLNGANCLVPVVLFQVAQKKELTFACPLNYYRYGPNGFPEFRTLDYFDILANQPQFKLHLYRKKAGGVLRMAVRNRFSAQLEAQDVPEKIRKQRLSGDDVSIQFVDTLSRISIEAMAYRQTMAQRLLEMK